MGTALRLPPIEISGRTRRRQPHSIGAERSHELAQALAEATHPASMKRRAQRSMDGRNLGCESDDLSTRRHRQKKCRKDGDDRDEKRYQEHAHLTAVSPREAVLRWARSRAFDAGRDFRRQVECDALLQTDGMNPVVTEVVHVLEARARLAREVA